MKKFLFLILCISLFGCGTLTQHRGMIPQDISVEDYGDIDTEKGEFSTILCAEGERAFYAFGTSKPSLNIKFDDEGFKLIKSSYNAVRLNAGNRDFTITFTFRDQFAHFKVRDFQFEPDTTYLAKYSATQRQVKVWIEKENGEVVFGEKPKEGQF